jgi:hypothetical protein
MKNKMTEREASSVFIISIVKGVEKDWPDIAAKLIPIIGIDLQKDEKAQFDFAMALIAVQMQTLPNLLPSQQAVRLKTYILEGISFESEYWTTLYRELIKEYDSTWQVALSKQQPPHESIGSLLYDQFNCEQKITCIAHGREPDDPEMTTEVMQKQYEGLEKILEEHEEEMEIDFDEADNPEFEKIKEHIKFVENNPLPVTAEQYRKKAQEFLKGTFYKEEEKYLALDYDFETVAWYHTLLVVKLQRALAGFHEPAHEGDLSLYDAIAQLEICKKAIKESINALRKIDPNLPYYHLEILELLVLLHNIHSRIEVMESSI